MARCTYGSGASSGDTHLNSNTSWHVLEIRKQEDTDPYKQYVWSRRYIDAPVLRDRDADEDSQTGDLGVTGSGLEERLYYTTDANMNVTALVNTSGTVLERYVYDPYGNVTIYEEDWSNTRSASAYDNAIRYCGYVFDNETGLYHVRHRSYHPALGRWLQRDLSVQAQGEGEEGVYDYVGSCPTSWVDWRGLARSRPSQRETQSEIDRAYPPNRDNRETKPLSTRDGATCCYKWHPPMWKRAGFKSLWDCICFFYKEYQDANYENVGLAGVSAQGAAGIAVPAIGGGCPSGS